MPEREYDNSPPSGVNANGSWSDNWSEVIQAKQLDMVQPHSISIWNIGSYLDRTKNNHEDFQLRHSCFMNFLTFMKWVKCLTIALSEVDVTTPRSRICGKKPRPTEVGQKHPSFCGPKRFKIVCTLARHWGRGPPSLDISSNPSL